MMIMNTSIQARRTMMTTKMMEKKMMEKKMMEKTKVCLSVGSFCVSLIALFREQCSRCCSILRDICIS